jgi:hypothetical protein
MRSPNDSMMSSQPASFQPRTGAVRQDWGETTGRRVGNPTKAFVPDMPRNLLRHHHNQRLTRNPSTTLTGLFACESFVSLDGNGPRVPVRRHHGYPQLLQSSPCGFVAWQAQNPLASPGVEAAFLTRNLPDSQKLHPQGCSRVLKDGASCGQYRVIALTAAMESPLSGLGLTMPTRATKPIRPAHVNQIPAPGLFGSKKFFKFLNGSGIISNFPSLPHCT